MLVQELKKLQLQKELVSIYRVCADAELVGTIEYVNPVVVIACLYEATGDYAGHTVFHTDQIYKTLWAQPEHHALKQLIAISGPKPRFQASGDHFDALLRDLSGRYSSVCIYSEDNERSVDVAGVMGLSDAWLKLQTIVPGNPPVRGFKLIEAEAVMRFTVNSPYQNRLVALAGQGAGKVEG